MRGIYGRFDSKIRFEIESDGRFDSRFDSNAKKTIRRSLLLTVICNGVDDYKNSDPSHARHRNDSVTPAPYVADRTHILISQTESNAKIFNLSTC